MSKALTILRLISTLLLHSHSFPSTLHSFSPWREDLKGLACCLDALENSHNKQRNTLNKN